MNGIALSAFVGWFINCKRVYVTWNIKTKLVMFNFEVSTNGLMCSYRAVRHIEPCSS